MDMELCCAGCGKNFSVPFRANRIDKIKYCSLECFNATKQKSVACLHCGVLFRVGKSSGRKFCADTCYHAHRHGQKCQKTCKVCGKAFETTSTRKDTAQFCSHQCRGQDPSWREAISERQSGPNHWRWKGGKSKQVLLAYDKGTYRRDFTQHMIELAPNHPFLVTRSGIKVLSRKIHIHHIDRNPMNNELGNLLAVTIDAHAKIHHSGRKPEPWECWPPNPERW